MARATIGRMIGIALGAAALAACNGQIGSTAAERGTGESTRPGDPGITVGPNGPEMPGASSAWADLATTAPSSVARLLSQRELGNALEVLVGFRPQALSDLPADK